MYQSIEEFMGHIEAKNQGEKEFHQAVQEVVESIWVFLLFFCLKKYDLELT